MAKSGTAQARDSASKRTVTMQQLAPLFWAAVEDCLVQFHQFSKGMAADKVTDFRRRLDNISIPSTDARAGERDPGLADMIYHAEPWYLACNLAGEDLPLEPNRTTYQEILVKNQLA